MKKIFFISIALFLLITAPVSAQLDLWGGQQDNIKDKTGLGETDPREMAASIIQVLLGFLGIIAVVLILYAGFLWMTAAGDDAKIKTAKGTLMAGVIGLIIILMAYGIATMVINEIMEATGANP